jgi:hypothetical protein
LLNGARLLPQVGGDDNPLDSNRGRTGSVFGSLVLPVTVFYHLLSTDTQKCSIRARCSGSNLGAQPGMLRQEDLKFKDSLGFTVRPCLNKPKHTRARTHTHTYTPHMEGGREREAERNIGAVIHLSRHVQTHIYQQKQKWIQRFWVCHIPRLVSWSCTSYMGRQTTPQLNVRLSCLSLAQGSPTLSLQTVPLPEMCQDVLESREDP